jgi:hypothetical protein
MKNVEIWSRVADRKILAAAAAFCILLLAAFVGGCLPGPEPDDVFPLINGFIAAMLLVFVWGLFGVVRPSRRGQGWLMAQAVGIPLIWLLLVTVFGLWFRHVYESWFDSMPLRLT